MTTPPLPASPTLRVKLDYTDAEGTEAGSRFYLTYAGAAPTAGNCVTLAGDVAAAWASHIAANVQEAYALTEVDVLDIASYVGLSGSWTGSNAGTMGGSAVPSSVASNIEFGIARRYRGGKPRMYLPPPDVSALSGNNKWTTDFQAQVTADFEAFMTEIEALSIGAVGALAHVNLSYYQGFKNIINSSGRERAVPQYRDTALVDLITSYGTKLVVGSQRRRRTSTSY